MSKEEEEALESPLIQKYYNLSADTAENAAKMFTMPPDYSGDSRPDSRSLVEPLQA
jgi:hypothetical protein